MRVQMDNEIKKLAQLLENKKITEDEFKLLSEAITVNKKTTRFKLSFFINPFEKISGYQALFFGIIVILGLTAFAVLRNDNFPGLIDYNYAPFNYKIGQEFKITYLYALYQNALAVVVLSLLYYAFSKFYKQKSLRIIDFFGTVALARFPLFVQSILGNIMTAIDPTMRRSPHESILSIIGWFYVLGCFIWLIVTYFYALKESSGLTGKKLWISYVGSVAIGEIICALLTRMYFPPDYHL